MFAAELYDTWPDIMCLGKGMSGGYAPLSAVVMTTEVARPFWGEPRDLVQFHSGHTYGANPVACAIGLAAIAQLREEDLADRAVARGERLRAGLRAIAGRHPAIGDVRGLGLLTGVELVTDRATRERFPAALEVGVRIRDEARRRGLLVRASHWMFVLAPPLTVSDAEVDEILGILGEACDAVLPAIPAAAGTLPGAGA